MSEHDIEHQRKKIMNKVQHFFSGSRDEDDELSAKRRVAKEFILKNKEWFIWGLLAFIVLIGVYIRTRNFWLLKDTVTGAWLSIDLDSHIYLKYARYIAENGFLPDVDMTRFIPFGAPTANYAFPAYFIYYLYKLMAVFSPSVTVEYADVVYPLVAFSVGLVFFFLLARKVFNVWVALLSSFLLAIIPAYLQRTLGGSSDHDVLGIMFMFMSLYLIYVAWESKTLLKSAVLGGFAGIATGLTGLSWGAWKFVALIFCVFVLFELLRERVEMRHALVYGLWLAFSIVVMTAWVPLFTFKTFVFSVTTAVTVFVLGALIVHVLVFEQNVLKLKDKIGHRFPPALTSIGIAVLIGVIAVIIFAGPMLLAGQLQETKQLLLHPMGKDRWELTVAEQYQPYLKDIAAQFGPSFGVGEATLPLLFVFFSVGMVFLFYRMVEDNKKGWVLTAVFVLCLIGLLFNRYSRDSVVFNGTTGFAVFVYFGSIIVFFGLGLAFYIRSYFKDKETFKEICSWNSGYFLIFIWTFFMLIAARGAIRLVFVAAPVVALLGAYGVVELVRFFMGQEQKVYRYGGMIVVVFVLLSPFASSFSGLVPSSYENSIKQATYSGPPYNQPWQFAGKWVQDNVPKDAVFGHWWDYGYWVQNGWNRASVLDGANKVKYWNYLMGRHVLTGQSQQEALEFLYVHNTTHYLIVSEDIGKYTAYSSIGSDGNYDRYSWIMTFALNAQGTKETRNGSVFMYQGAYVLDDDFTWKGKVYPRQQAGIGAVFLPITNVGGNSSDQINIEQPTIALVYQNQRVDVPLTCVYVNEQMWIYPGEGYNGCLRLMPVLDGNGQLVNPIGAGLFVSEEGMRALWTNLYVFNQKNPRYDTSAFELVYGEAEARVPLAMYQGRLIGPIKIWEIHYPTNFTVDPEIEKRYLGGNEYLPDYFFEVE